MFVGNVPRQFVLRHFVRGGLVRKLVYDRYLWTGEDTTRSFLEWRMLARMADRGLRVPRPDLTRDLGDDSSVGLSGGVVNGLNTLYPYGTDLRARSTSSYLRADYRKGGLEARWYTNAVSADMRFDSFTFSGDATLDRSILHQHVLALRPEIRRHLAMIAVLAAVGADGPGDELLSATRAAGT